MLSCFNREIAANGYLTQLGLWHDNAENPFNLSSDLMESFRPLIDQKVRAENFKNFDTDEKMLMINFLNEKVMIAQGEQYINNAIAIYVQSVFAAIDANDERKIQNWYEL